MSCRVFRQPQPNYSDSWWSVPARARDHGRLVENFPQGDGSHDFAFLIGGWKAHVRRLPARLNNFTTWVEYNGVSHHTKMLDSNSNLEELEATSADQEFHPTSLPVEHLSRGCG
jgi:hypothetical protein